MNIVQTIDQTRERAFGAARRFKTALIEHANSVFDRADHFRKEAIENAETLSKEVIENAGKLSKEAIEEGKELKAKFEDVARKAIDETREAADDIAKPLLKGGTNSKRRAKKRGAAAKKNTGAAIAETKAELYAIATEMKIVGRSKMTKSELLAAIEKARH